MNRIDFSEKVVTENQLDLDSRRRNKSDTCTTLETLENKMASLSIRGTFYRQTISSSKQSYCCHCNGKVNVVADNNITVCEVCLKYMPHIQIIEANLNKLHEDITMQRPTKQTDDFQTTKLRSMSIQICNAWDKAQPASTNEID